LVTLEFLAIEVSELEPTLLILLTGQP